MAIQTEHLLNEEDGSSKLGGVDLGGHRAGRTAPGALPACEPYVQASCGQRSCAPASGSNPVSSISTPPCIHASNVPGPECLTIRCDWARSRLLIRRVLVPR